MAGIYLQDPDDRLDYAVDWTSFLAVGETITTFTVTGTGVTVTSSAQANGIVTYWVAGGTAGVDGTVTCHITTSTGRQKDSTDQFMIRSL